MALAATSDRTVSIWNTTTGARLYHLTGHTQLITAAAILPDGSQAMTAALDGTIRVWDLTNGQVAFIIAQNGQVADAASSADGTLIASCDTSNPSTAYLWDARDGCLLRVFSDIFSDSSPMKGVAISPDHTMLVTSHTDGRTRVWGHRPHSTADADGHGPAHRHQRAGHADLARAVLFRGGCVRRSQPGGDAGGGHTPNPADAGRTQAGGTSRCRAIGRRPIRQPRRPCPGPRAQRQQRPPATADITAFRMTSMRGRLPSAYDYETFTQAPVTNLHCEMPLALTSSGKAYILVFAPYLSAGTIEATIHAEYADFHLKRCFPGTRRQRRQGHRPHPGHRHHSGHHGATVRPQCHPRDRPTRAVGRRHQGVVHLPLAGVAPGSYQLEITRPGMPAVAVDNAFQVVSAVGPLLQIEPHRAVIGATKPRLRDDAQIRQHG